MRESKSRFVHVADAQIFVEWIGPPLHLAIFGAGHDAIPLVAIAKQFGWRVTIADGRPAYATRERFPEADRVTVICGNDPLKGISICPQTAVVMMTHNYPLDERLLPGSFAARPWYLEMLGPKSRTENLFGGQRIPANVHGPVGLDLGGETPESIAVSIVSEIEAARHQRAGGMLRLRESPIHAPGQEVGAPSAAWKVAIRSTTTSVALIG